MSNQEISQSDQRNQSLLLSLHHYTRYSSSLSSQKLYPELHQFRQKIEEEKSAPHHQPYQTGRKKALAYRIIFGSLGLLFVMLTLFIYYQSLNWSCFLLFENCILPKLGMCSLCIVLALAAFGMSIKIRTEKEAAFKLIQRARSKLIRYYASKRAQLGVHYYLSLSGSSQATLILRQSYQEALEKIYEGQEVALLLLERIALSRAAYAERVELFNQALLELDDKLQHIVYNFKKNLASYQK